MLTEHSFAERFALFNQGGRILAFVGEASIQAGRDLLSLLGECDLRCMLRFDLATGASGKTCLMNVSLLKGVK